MLNSFYYLNSVEHFHTPRLPVILRLLRNGPVVQDLYHIHRKRPTRWSAHIFVLLCEIHEFRILTSSCPHNGRQDAEKLYNLQISAMGHQYADICVFQFEISKFISKRPNYVLILNCSSVFTFFIVEFHYFPFYHPEQAFFYV